MSLIFNQARRSLRRSLQLNHVKIDASLACHNIQKKGATSDRINQVCTCRASLESKTPRYYDITNLVT